MRGKEVRLIFLAVSLVILMISASFAEDLKTSVDLTAVGMGARPIALGGAYTGIADDASAIFTNPAGLGNQNTLSFVSMSTQILTCVDYQLAGFSYPTQYGTFGLGYIAASTPAGDYIHMVGSTTVEGGAMNYTNQMLILSYGGNFSDQARATFIGKDNVKYFGLGANVKLLSQGLSGSIRTAPSASGLTADIGAIYAINDRVTVGAAVQNLGGSLSWSTGEREKLPMLLKLGGAYKALDNVTVALDTDFDLDGGRDMVAHSGVEWQVIQYLALRAGIDQKAASVDDATTGSATSYTAGVGLMFQGFRFDYAYRQDPNYSEFSTHYFSLCFTGPEIGGPAKTENDTISQSKTENDTISQSKTENNNISQYEKLLEKNAEVAKTDSQ